LQPQSSIANVSDTSRVNLRGIFLPFTTPFTGKEDLDLAGLRENLRKWNSSGIAGYVALGSTGERVNLDEREYLQVVETSREEIPASLSFIVGVGQQSTRQTINEVRRVAAAGADAVLAITPNFYRAAITQAALVDHYSAIADASPIPVILYSMPDLTGIVIEPSTAAELSKHRNILGIKDSSSDIPRFSETLKAVSNEFVVLTGNGTVLYDALVAGSRGAILAVGCVAASICLQIYQDVSAGNTERALALQQKLAPLALAVTKRYGIGGLKVAMDQLGFIGGAVRAPLKSPNALAREEIAELLRSVSSVDGKRNQLSQAVLQEQ
jgi:dihydrodipicolinate synthase/N-acetylneuraminate lyase